MAAVRILMFFIAPLLFLSTLPIYHGVHAIEIITEDDPDPGQAADGPVDIPNTGQAGPRGDRPDNEEGMAAVVARIRAIDDLIANGGTLEMWMVLICVDLQDIVFECRRVQDFDTFFSNLPRVNTERSRRKRFASTSWFGSSDTYGGLAGGGLLSNFHESWPGNSYSSFQNSWPSDSSSSYGSSGSSGSFSNVHYPSSGGSYGSVHNPSSSGSYGNVHNPSSGGSYGNVHNPSSGGSYGNAHNPISGGSYGNIHNPSSGGSYGNVHNPSSSGSYGSVHNPGSGGFYGNVNNPWFGSSPTNVYKPSPGGFFVHNFPGSGNSTSNAVVCPSPTNQSLIYDLNPNSAGYPAEEIGNEIVNSGPLQDCLARQVLRPNDPPTILVEPFELTANVTCPFDQLRLWQYQSQAINAMCWVLQNFQENILYRICNTRFCKNCTDSPATKTTTRGYGKQNQGVAQRDNRNQKFCITEYRTVSLWAYCPTLPAGTRIIRDRIIVPFACSCQSIRCDPIPTQRRK